MKTTVLDESQNFLFGKCLEEEQFRLSVRSMLENTRPLSDLHAKIITMLKQESFSYSDLCAKEGACVTAFAMRLSNEYVKQKWARKARNLAQDDRN